MCSGDSLQPVFGVHAQDLGAQTLQLDLWLQVILTPGEQIEKGEMLRCSCSLCYLQWQRPGTSHNTVVDIVGVIIISSALLVSIS